MDNKTVGILAVIVVVAVCIVGGYAFLNNDSDDKDIKGEWLAAYAQGYNNDGSYYLSDDREELKNYDINITAMDHNVVVMTLGDNVFRGTYEGNNLYLSGTFGGYLTTAIGEITQEYVIFNFLGERNDADDTIAYKYIYSRDGTVIEKGPVVATLPENWQIFYSNEFNGTDHALTGTELTISDQNRTSFVGDMQQKIGTGQMTIPFKGVMRSTTVDEDFITLDVIDDEGLIWRFIYGVNDKVLNCAACSESTAYEGLSSYSRAYTTDGEESDLITEPQLAGLTWYGEGLWSLDNDDNIVKKNEATRQYTLNITSQNNRQFSGTFSYNDRIFDLAGYCINGGFNYLVSNGDFMISGTATISSDLKNITWLENYTEIDDAFIVGCVKLTQTEPAEVNKFLGDWYGKYFAGYINGEYSEPKVLGEEIEISVDSIKNGLFWGKYDDIPVTGLVSENSLRFVFNDGTYDVDVVCYIDNGIMQSHMIFTNSKDYEVYNLALTREESTTELADYPELLDSYTSVYKEKYDGTTTTEMVGETMTVEQNGSLFKVTMDLDDNGKILSVTSTGYLTKIGDKYLGKIFASNNVNIINVDFTDDGHIILAGFNKDYNCVYMRDYSPDDKETTPIIGPELKGSWESIGVSDYYVDSGFLLLPSDWELEITDQNRVFISGTYGTHDILGIIMNGTIAVYYGDNTTDISTFFVTDSGLDCVWMDRTYSGNGTLCLTE